MEIAEHSLKSSAESHSADRKVWISGNDLHGFLSYPKVQSLPKRSVWLNYTEREAKNS